MKLLIVGCPHSGTMFTAQVLGAAGVVSTHEGTYTLEGHRPGNKALVEVAWEAVLHLGRSTIPKDVVIAHQTRDPIAWLNSWTRLGRHDGKAWPLLEGTYPGIRARRDRDPVRTAMWLWVQMNLTCAQYADQRYRIEDLHGKQGAKILRDIGKHAGIKMDRDRLREALAAVDRRTNHHPAMFAEHVPSTWSSLPRGDEFTKFKKLAEKYGYSTA